MTQTPPTTSDPAANILAMIIHKASKPDVGGDPAFQEGQSIIDRATQEAQTTDTTTGDTTAGGTSPDLGSVPVNQPYGKNGHPGIDLGIPVGTPLVALENGTVTVASNADPGGYGNEVEITAADGTVMRYGHLSAINVKQGQTISKGQPIGASGGAAGATGSGNSTGAHLHFEVRKGGSTVDPVPYLAGSGGVVDGSATSNAAASYSGDTQIDRAADIVDIAAGKHPDRGQQSQATTKGQTTGADDDPAAVDSFLAATRTHESGGDYKIYNQSGLSNASGAYQFIGTTWRGLGGSTQNAAEASPQEQDAVARKYALSLFQQFHSWKLVAAAWYGGPGVAQQMAAGKNVGSPSGQGSYADYANTIASMMAGGGKK